MRTHDLNTLLLGVLLLLVFPDFLFAQKAPNECGSKQERLTAAITLINAFQNDSANVVLTGLIEELESQGSINTPFALKVRMRQAEVLEKGNQDEIAIKKLLKILEDGEQYEQWDVVTNAHLSLARLYEKLERAEDCLAYLNRASSSIIQHQLDSIYPRFYIRMSSYQRIFNEKDSALIYAREVLRTSTLFEQEEHLGVGYMLLGILLRDSLPQEAIKNSLKAGEIFQNLNDYMGYAFTAYNVSKCYFNAKEFKLALAYNDSVINSVSKMVSKGLEKDYTSYVPFKFRGEIFKELGDVDSLWLYLNKSYEMELEYAYQLNHDKIIEVEKRYNDEQKTKKIEEQKLLLQYENERKTWLTVIATSAIIFIFILAYFYMKLRNANRKTEEQAAQIATTNQELSIALNEQILLQGEMHHRVKNNLQTIVSLLELQSEELEDPKALESLAAMSNRIYSIAAVHEMLYSGQENRCIDLLDYTNKLCQHVSGFLEESSLPIYELDIEESSFDLSTLMPLDMILNELLTNSLKYARQVHKKLRISICLKAQSNGYYLTYRDNGMGFPVGVLKEREGGLGTYLLISMSRQLNGQLITRNDDGAIFELFFKEKNR